MPVYMMSHTIKQNRDVKREMERKGKGHTRKGTEHQGWKKWQIAASNAVWIDRE